MKRKDVEAHIADVCPWTVHSCALCTRAWESKWPLAEQPVVYVRKDRTAHLLGKRSYHTLILTDEQLTSRPEPVPVIPKKAKVEDMRPPLLPPSSSSAVSERKALANGACAACAQVHQNVTVNVTNNRHLQTSTVLNLDLENSSDYAYFDWMAFTFTPTSNVLVVCYKAVRSSIVHLKWWDYNPISQTWKPPGTGFPNCTILEWPDATDLDEYVLDQIFFVRGHLVLAYHHMDDADSHTYRWSTSRLEQMLTSADPNPNHHVGVIRAMWSQDYKLHDHLSRHLDIYAQHALGCGCIYVVSGIQHEDNNTTWYLDRYRLPVPTYADTQDCGSCYIFTESRSCNHGGFWRIFEDVCDRRLTILCGNAYSSPTRTSMWTSKEPPLRLERQAMWSGVDHVHIGVNTMAGHASTILSCRQEHMISIDPFAFRRAQPFAIAALHQPGQEPPRKINLQFSHCFSDRIRVNEVESVSLNSMLWAPVHHVYVPIFEEGGRFFALCGV